MSAAKRKRDKPREEQWTKLVRPMMQTDAWRALPTSAQALYPWLRMEWRGPPKYPNNNGRISLSVRQAAKALGVSVETAGKAFHALQAKGFIVVTTPASLGFEGEAKAPEFELTEIEMPHSETRGGRKLYSDWRPGCDFPVHKTRTNTPTGRNGAKARPRNQDVSVLEIRTVSR